MVLLMKQIYLQARSLHHQCSFLKWPVRKIKKANPNKALNILIGRWEKNIYDLSYNDE